MLQKAVLRFALSLLYIYAFVLDGWTVVYLLFEDRWWWMFLFNSFAAYFLFGGLLLLPVALLSRRYVASAGLGVALLMGPLLYGDVLLPNQQTAQADGTTLTVMTSNLLGFNMDTEGIIAAIAESDADVVALQELNPPVAQALETQLGTMYPYRLLAPKQGVGGMGVISRYPLRPADVVVAEGGWVGDPQAVLVDVAGREVMLFNYHGKTVGLGSAERFNWSLRVREQQTQEIVKLAQDYGGPFIALGDLNATSTSRAYRIMTDELADAWSVAGNGLGHTFPGAASQGSSRMRVAGVPVPKWLVRIDFICYSEHLQALSADHGVWDGQSDHRPVRATLSL